MKKPIIPTARVSAPIIEKITVQLASLSRSKNINPPKTTRTETRGIMAFIPSAFPLFEESVESVSQALNAASFAVEPKSVITQSRIIVSATPTVIADTVAGINFPIISVRRSTKLKMEIPQST